MVKLELTEPLFLGISILYIHLFQINQKIPINYYVLLCTNFFFCFGNTFPERSKLFLYDISRSILNLTIKILLHMINFFWIKNDLFTEKKPFDAVLKL